jgi:hypothetical protein
MHPTVLYYFTLSKSQMILLIKESVAIQWVKTVTSTSTCKKYYNKTFSVTQVEIEKTVYINMEKCYMYICFYNVQAQRICRKFSLEIFCVYIELYVNTAPANQHSEFTNALL